MRVVFMGTPDFAAKSLKKLIDEKFDIVGVFTQPDRPAKRGMKLLFSPVKELAVEAGIPVFQPEKLRTQAALEQFRTLRPDIAVVVAYGRILPDEFLETPELGCINVHGSLLPAYRGAAPIQHAVLDGIPVTGVTTMYLASEMDSGDVIYTDSTEIGDYETSGGLFERLADMGAQLLVRTLRDIASGTAPRYPQDHSKATFAPPLTKDMGPIDWTGTPRQVIKHICGLDPWPGAVMDAGGVTLRVFSAEFTENSTEKAPGEFVASTKRGLEVACGGGKTVLITGVQAPGGKRMSAADYFRGHPVSIED